MWKDVHSNWFWKSQNHSGNLDGMRLTGQATTAIGNAIINLMVHTPLIERNKDKLEWYLFLGDDGLIGFKDQPNLKNLGVEIATNFNM